MGFTYSAFKVHLGMTKQLTHTQQNLRQLAFPKKLDHLNFQGQHGVSFIPNPSRHLPQVFQERRQQLVTMSGWQLASVAVHTRQAHGATCEQGCWSRFPSDWIRNHNGTTIQSIVFTIPAFRCTRIPIIYHDL